MCFINIPPSGEFVKYDEDLHSQNGYTFEFQEIINSVDTSLSKIKEFIKNHTINVERKTDIQFPIGNEFPDLVLSIRYTDSKKEWDNDARCSDDYVARYSIKILYYISLSGNNKGILICKKHYYYNVDFWDNDLSDSHSETFWLRNNIVLDMLFLIYENILLNK